MTEAFRQARIRAGIPFLKDGQVRCEVCEGTGIYHSCGDEDIPCWECDETGYIDGSTWLRKLAAEQSRAP